MKKKFFGTLFTLVVVFTIATSALAAAAALPGTGWWSGETIQNVSASTAGLTLTAYDSLSSNTYQTTFNLPTGQSKTFVPGDFTGMPAGFQGSMVVSSSADIRAIVNVTNRVSGTLGDPASVSPAAGQYQGVIIPSTIINFPLVKNNHFSKTTSFAIQNAGSAAATATASFTFVNAPNPATVYSYTTPSIGVGQMVIISPADAKDPSNNPPPSGNGSIGALTVQSAQPLAGTSLEYYPAETNATVLQTTRAMTSNDYDTTLYAPTIKHLWFNRTTGLNVQNVSGGTINITATFKGTGGACNGITYPSTQSNIAPGRLASFAMQSILPSNCLATATVTAGGNIVGQVNEAFNGTLTNGVGKQEATVYSTFPLSSATTVVSIPVYKEDSYSKSTGINIQNVSNFTANNVVIKLVNGLGTFTSVPQSIASKSSINFVDLRFKPTTYWSGTPLSIPGCVNTLTGCGSNGLFAMVITSDQPIVVIANESTYPNATPRFYMDKNNYEGFNLITAP